MPPVVAAVKAVAAWKIGSFAIGQYIIGSVISYAIGQIIAKKPKMPERFEQGLKVNNTSNTYAIPVVYGRRRIGGSEYRAVSGSDNRYLWRVMVISEGEIEEVEDILLNEKSVDHEDYQHHVIYNVSHRGQSGDSADSTLDTYIPNWTDKHVGNKIAYIWVRLHFDTDVFPQGLPKLNALVKGKKIYDPRLDSTVAGGSGSHRTSDESTWEWSENPALCILDYLTNTIYGRGVPYEDIDLNSFMVEADYCDETITLRDAAGNDLPNQKRYTCNGVVNPEEESLNILRDLLAACRGALVSPNDKFRLVIDKPANSVFTFDEDNILGAWTITGAGTRGKKNRIQTRFFDKDNRYDEAITLTTSSGGLDFLAQDNGRILQSDIALNFTDERIRADILAQHLLKQLRLSWKVSFTCNIKGIAVEAMDVIAIKHPAVGWDSGELSNGKLFRVNLVEILDTDTIKITAEEYDSSVYTFDVNTPQASPTTNLPDPESAPAPTSLTLDSSEILVNKDGTIIERIYANWTEPDYAFVHHYEIAYKSGNDNGFTIVATDDDSFYISPVNSVNEQFNGQYFVKVRAVYPNGKRSAWYPSNEGEEHEVLGKSAPPNKPTAFTYKLQTNYVRQFNWNPPEDRDIAGYQIRYSSELTDEWDDMEPLHLGVITTIPFETTLLSAGTYRFAIKSIDTSGNYSLGAQYITAELSDNPNVEILQAYYPRLLGWHKVGKSGTITRKKYTADIVFNGVTNAIDFYYDNKENVLDYWRINSGDVPFANYVSDTSHTIQGVPDVVWKLSRYRNANGTKDVWRIYSVDAADSDPVSISQGGAIYEVNVTSGSEEYPKLGTYTSFVGGTSNVTLTTAYDFNNSGNQTGAGSGSVEITYTVSPYDHWEMQHSTDGFSTFDTLETGVAGSQTTSLVRDYATSTYSGSFRIVGYSIDGNCVNYPNSEGGVSNPISGELDSYASPSAEWTDLNTTTWDNWNEWGFASETLTYETFGFEFGTTLLFKPILQSTHIGSVAHEVSIVPDTVEGFSGFTDSDYSAFFTPSGSISAKAIRTKTTVTGVNSTIKSLSILLDGKQVEETLLNINTASVDQAYRIATGHIYIPLQKEFTQASSIQVTFIGGGGSRSYEVVDKTTTVDGKLAPELKFYDNGNLSDATIDIIVKGF